MQNTRARAVARMRAHTAGFVLALIVSACAESPVWLETPITLSGEQLQAGEVIDHVVATAGISSMIAADARTDGAIDLQLKDVPARAVLEALSMICAELEFKLIGETLLVVAVKARAAAPPAPAGRDLAEAEPAARAVLPEPMLPAHPLPRLSAPPLPPDAIGSNSSAESVQLAPEPAPGTEPIADELMEFEVKPLNFGDIKFKAGCAHLEAGQIELARACFISALKENPDGDYRLTPEQMRLLDAGE